MPKIIKYLLLAFGALLGLLLIVIGIVVATFDPNDYKPLAIRLVQEKKQRTLTIPGDIKLTFFPKIGADLGKVTISEHKGTAEFASINSARVSLELIPLLSKQLIVDRVMVDGINAHIRRFKDGTTNFDDLLSKDESASEQIRFDVDSVNITNAHVLYEDQQQGRTLDVANLNLETGKLADGVPGKLVLAANVKGSKPDIDAKVAINSGFTFDLGTKHYVLKDMDAQVSGKVADFADLIVKVGGDADLKPADRQFALNGVKVAASGKRAGQMMEATLAAPRLAMTDARVSGEKLDAAAKLTEGARTMTMTFSAPSFEGSPQAFRLPSIALDAVIKDAQLDAKARLSGTIAGDLDKLLFTSPQLNIALDGKQGAQAINGSLSTPLSADLKTQVIDLSQIAAAFTLPNPGGGTLKLKADGKAGIDLGKQSASASLKGSLDESAFDARLGLAKFSPAAYTFDVTIDKLDVDRYQKKSATAPAATSASASAASAEKPFDLSALKDLNASGTLKIGALKAANVKAANVRLEARAANGKVDINPLAANLYGGSVAGAVSATASNPPRFSVTQKFVGIDLGPLMKDALNKNPIDGKGNVQLNLTAQGATVSQLKKSLDGTARLELRDGAVHGINVAQTIRNAKARIGALQGGEAPQAGAAASNEKTDFTELSGSFRIDNGVARNDDLSAKSPLLRLGGAGSVNLADERLDYLVKATVVTTLQGQGGPELQALKGITVPVKLTGPFTSISWNVDFAGIATELAKQKIDEKKGEVEAKARQAIDAQKGKVQEELKGKLKGLFGK